MSNGYVPNGVMPNGYTPNGLIPNGYAANNVIPNGVMTPQSSCCGNQVYSQASTSVVSPTQIASTTARNHLMTGCGYTPCTQKTTSGPTEQSACPSTCPPDQTMDVCALVATHVSVEGNLWARGLQVFPSWARRTVVQETMPCQSSGQINKKIRGPNGCLICLDDIDFENSCGISGHVYASYAINLENGSMAALRHVSGTPSIQNTSNDLITITTHIHYVRFRPCCNTTCVVQCEKSCDRSCSCSKC